MAHRSHRGRAVSVSTFITLSLMALTEPESALPVVSAATYERLLLPAGTRVQSLRIHAMEQRLELRVGPMATAVASQLTRAPSRLCPDVSTQRDLVLLRCRTRRIMASLGTANGRAALDVSEVRGLPWLGPDDAPTELVYAPERLGLGQACPGSTPVGRGECLRARGQYAEAVKAFTEGLAGPDVALAALRLGDLALQLRGASAEAVAWYLKAGTRGPFARLAQSRLCEMTGHCLAQVDVSGFFDGSGLPEPIRTELELRRLRIDIFQGQPFKALTRLQKRMTDSSRPHPCTGAPSFCFSVVTVGLRDDSPATRALAVDLYLRLRGVLPEGERWVSLTGAAAEAAVTLGATQFAANLLASTTGQVGADGLSAHLLKTSELYLAAGDPLHAAVVLEFARARWGPTVSRQPGWSQIADAIEHPAQPLPAHPTGPDADLQAAQALLAAQPGATP